MKLFLIKTERGLYSTNANSKDEAISKFMDTYPEYQHDYESSREIDVGVLVDLPNNDDIIFF